MTKDSSRLSDLSVRFITGALLVVIAGAAVWFGGSFFALLVAAASALVLGEWRGLTGLKPAAYRLALALLAVGLAIAVVDVRAQGLWTSAAVLIAGCVLLVPWAGAAAFGLAYAGLPAAALLWLRALPWGFELVAWVLAVVIATDVFAYFAGRTMGGRKLAPSISPGKTWAGLIGGVVAAIVIGWLVARYFGLPPWLGLMGGVMAVLAQAGDLFESWMKRRAGVKDSGTLLPGHGGVMDRIDGLLPVAVATAAAMLAGMRLF